MKNKIGYTCGVFDLFHIGHLNVLKEAKKSCDYLVVGLVTDEESIERKNKRPFYCFEERKKILESIKYVDRVIKHVACNDLSECKKIGASIQFVGSDWKGTDLYNKMEIDYKKYGIKIKYIKYTKGISSTKLRNIVPASDIKKI